MLHDCIVTGLRDYGHRERLLRESTLTLQKAIDICRTNRMAASQQHKMEESSTIHFTREERKHGPRENTRRNPHPTRRCKYYGDTHAAGNVPQNNGKLQSPLFVREYWPYSNELSTQNGLIIIPHSMRTKMTTRAHHSHLGIQYIIKTVRDIMYWPSMTADLTEAVQRCETFQQMKPALPKEPMMTYLCSSNLTLANRC